jgi:exodeoxyribonuclease V alpha subunit
MRVAVQSIVSAREFGAIISARIADHDHPLAGQTVRVKISGAIAPTIGETWDIDGEVMDTQWGRQVEAARAVRVLPTGKLVIDFLSAHAPGVGPERAARLWTHFGMDLTQALSDPDNIDEIARVLAPDRPNLAPRLAAACVAAWQDAEAEAASVMWLAEKGVDDVAIARRVARILGENAVPRLNDNPYCLVPLLSWKRVDALGLKLLAESGCAEPKRDQRRLVGAVDAAVKAAIADGHTAGELQDLAVATGRLLGDPTLAGCALSAGESASAYWIPVGGGWRAPGAGQLEENLIERLRSVLSSTPELRLPSKNALESRLVRFESQGRRLHAEQQIAVLRALESPLACLSGGAGVGKTTTTKAICDLWEDFGGKVILAAVAGKAALRMSRATGRLAMTVFRLLRSCEDEDEEKRTRIDGRTLVIIDEASMLDLPSAAALLAQFEDGARLLMVGDEAQLPPIGFGLVYHKLVGDPRITSRLTVVHRQAEATGIPAVSAAIRAGLTPTLPAFNGQAKGVTLLECKNDEIGDRIAELCPTLSDAGETMVLTPLNDGPAGVRALNKRLHEWYRQRLDRPEMQGYLGEWFCVGDPVIFTRNDYSRSLWNGLVGRIEQLDFAERGAVVQFDGEPTPHELSTADLFDLRLAYALTGHKAQGSQAPTVIVALPKCRLLDRSWLYTAVTRAEVGVVLVGTQAMLDAAVAVPGQAERRRVGFHWDRSFL